MDRYVNGRRLSMRQFVLILLLAMLMVVAAPAFATWQDGGIIASDG